MKRRLSRSQAIALYSLGVGLTGWLLLLHQTPWTDLPRNIGPLLLFTGLSLLVKRLGFHVTRDVTHSLVGVVDLAAVFSLGTALGAWAAALSGLAYLELRALRHRLFTWRYLIEHPIFNSGLRAWMALLCGALYVQVGGHLAPQVLTWPLLVPLAITLLLWFAIDHFAWATRVFLRSGWEGLADFVRSIMNYSLLVELVPLPLSIVMALSYIGMGQPAFVLITLALVASGALLQRLTQVGTRLQKNVAELGILNDFGQALVQAELDVSKVCELLYDYCLRVVDAPTFMLELVQDGETQLDAVIDVRRGERQPRHTRPLNNAMQWMEEQREPLFRNHVQREGLPFPCDQPGDEPQSLAMIPLLVGSQLIGALCLQSDEAFAWAEDELRILLAMANQMAIAIANARVYEAERRRAGHLLAIGEVSRRVAAILELDQLFAYVVKLVQETFNYDHVGLFTVDAGSGEVVFRASTHPVIQDRGIEIVKGTGIIGSVAQTGEAILANDVNQEPRYLWEEALSHTRAELAVPLKAEERIVGVLDVQSSRAQAFSSEDLFVLRTLADQVAIAIEDTSLYMARQEEAWASTALLQVAEAVGSLDSLDAVLDTVVRITPMLVGVDRCGILLWDEERQEFVTTQGHTSNRDTPPLLGSLRFLPGELPLLDEVRAQRNPILITPETNRDLIPPQLAQTFAIGSLLALPLRAGGDVHGIMLVDYVDPTARFAERKRTILSGIADQAAMAIANARLLTSQREEAWVSTALLQVAQAVVSSADLRDNVARIARLAPILVGVDRCMVFLWDAERHEFVAFEHYGVNDESAFQSLRFKPGQMPLLDEVVRRQTFVAIEDARESALIPATMRQDLHMQCVLAVPLLRKDETLGALLVDYTQGTHRFDNRKISIVEGIAYQTAIAVENARLYQAALDQERSAQELRLAREIQISFLPECCPSLPGWEIAADWRAARGVGGDFYDFIPLSRDRLGLVIADVSDKGVPAALFMSLSRTLIRASATELRSPARVLERANELIVTETRSNMFVSLFYAVLNTKTGQLTYANAGHNPPVWWRQSSASMTSLTVHGVVLGVMEDIALQEAEITLEPGDTLVLYTDGVTEPINDQEEEFGETRLLQVIAATCQGSGQQVVDAIGQAVSSFAADRPLFDDYTLVALKRVQREPLAPAKIRASGSW